MLYYKYYVTRRKRVCKIITEAALQRCSYKKGVLKIYSKFTGEHPAEV